MCWINFCQLDILICNAGIAQQKLFGDLTDDDWRRMFAVNVDGVFHAVRAALPHFIHRKAGRIVTVSSMWGQVGGSCEVAYSAAKAAVIGPHKGFGQELGPSGITVNCVSPGGYFHGNERPSGPGSPGRPGGGDPWGHRHPGGRGGGYLVLCLRRRPVCYRPGAGPNGGLVI